MDRHLLERMRRFNLLDASMAVGLSLISILIRSLSGLQPLAVAEFDPWYIFYNALMLAQVHGNIFSVPPDVKLWYPWGFAVTKDSVMGLPLLIALISLPFYELLGPDAVYTAALFSDVVLAGLGVVAAYLTALAISGSRVGGVVAGMAIAVSPALTYKNLLGALPKTSWGAVFILLTVYLLSLSLERKQLKYSVLASVTFSLALLSWGGFSYLIMALAGASFLLILLGRNDEFAAKSLALMSVLSAFFTSLLPNGIGSLSSLTHGISLLVVSLVLFLDLRISRSLGKDLVKAKSILLSSVGVFLFLSIVIVLSLFAYSPIPGRYYVILNPFFQQKVAISTTVAEYIPQSITSLITDFGIFLFLFPLGVIFLLKRGNLSGLWLLLLGVTALLGTSQQPYLFNYTAYLVAVTAGVGVSYMVSRMREAGLRLPQVLVLGLVAFSSVADVSSAINNSDIPPAIYSASTPYPVVNTSWISALNWLRAHSSGHSLVLTWWDYGYWIEVIGNQSVIDANNTNNVTQIALMARIFLHNETYAKDLIEGSLHRYPLNDPRSQGPTYVVAFDAVTIQDNRAYLGYPTNLGRTFLGHTNSLGDIGKAVGAMTVITGERPTDYLNLTLINSTEYSIYRNFSGNPQLVNQLIQIVSGSYVMAWNQRMYNSLLAQMFVEGLQVQGYTVMAPFTNQVTPNGITPGIPLPPVRLMYFQPVYITMVPLYHGDRYTVYIMVVVYQFVEPGTFAGK